jgi:hypothetical protein
VRSVIVAPVDRELNAVLDDGHHLSLAAQTVNLAWVEPGAEALDGVIEVVLGLEPVAPLQLDGPLRRAAHLV